MIGAIQVPPPDVGMGAGLALFVLLLILAGFVVKHFIANIRRKGK